MISTEEALLHVRDLKERLGAQEAFLFGSIARGEQHQLSDIDVIFVKETTKRFHHRIGDVLDLVSVDIPIEPLVYTPEEFKQMQDTPALQEMLRGSIQV